MERGGGLELVGEVAPPHKALCAEHKAGTPEVTVTVSDTDHGTEDEPDPSWFVKFTFRGPGYGSGFVVYEPYSHTISDWMRLATGRS